MANEGVAVQADINGRKLLKSSDVSWTLRDGVSPNIQTFDLSPDDAKFIADTFGPLTLTITPPEGPPLVVKNLWCLNIQPDQGPFVSRVVLADRRWFWTFKWTGPKYYNHRRAVGTKRVLNNSTAAVPFSVAPLVAFAPWSLKDKVTRWVSYTMLLDVMGDVAEAEASIPGGERFKLTVDDRIGNRIKALPIENLTIDFQGDEAVRTALTYLPEAGVTVDYDGTVIIYSKAGGDESSIVSALMPEIRGKGHTDLVKNGNIRPREIHVLFTREVELRFDYLENASATDTTTADDPNDPLQQMDNVLPITDYQLTVDSNVLPQGTWITFDQAFNSWEAFPLQYATGFSQRMDHPLVQKAFVPQMDLWAALQIAGNRSYKDGSLKNWTGRISMCQQHYRRTFRLKRYFWDQIAAIKPYRLATVDPQSGQRGPATAHGDYALVYTQRTLWRNSAKGQEFDYAINRTAYPSGANSSQGVPSFDSAADVSPAIVSIVDKDQGIIHVDYVIDPNRVYEMILPSQLDVDTMPTADVTKRTRNIGFNAVINAAKAPKLSSSFKLAIMLTAVPASPNNNQQLHRIKVKPQDIAGFLPPSQTTGLDDAKGPIMEIRVGPNVEVARIQWLDSRADDIRKIFGIGSGQPNLDGLVLNEGPASDASIGASLTQIAKARAAAVYASLVDRYEGSMTGYMNPNVHLNGWISQITHRATVDGQVVTEVQYPPQVPQMSVASFLDSNTRALIFKLVSVEK